LRYLVIYDITDDGLRFRVAEVLKDYGLARIQKSAFIGSLSKNMLSSLIAELRGLVVDDNIKIFPLCEPDFKAMVSIGQEYREEDRRGIAFY